LESKARQVEVHLYLISLPKRVRLYLRVVPNRAWIFQSKVQ
jgi:hypothetical protein